MVHKYINFYNHESFNKERFHIIIFQEPEEGVRDGWISYELIIYHKVPNWKWAFLRHISSDYDYITYEHPTLYENLEDATIAGYTSALEQHDEDRVWPLVSGNVFSKKQREEDGRV